MLVKCWCTILTIINLCVHIETLNTPCILDHVQEGMFAQLCIFMSVFCVLYTLVITNTIGHWDIKKMFVIDLTENS